MGKITITECQNYAKKHNGECLDSEYDYNKKVKWRCSMGHEWSSQFYRGIKSWCRRCYDIGQRTDHKVIYEFAAKNKLKVTIGDYKVNNGVLKWECENNHVILRRFSEIRRKWHGCIKCRITIKSKNNFLIKNDNILCKKCNVIFSAQELHRIYTGNLKCFNCKLLRTLNKKNYTLVSGNFYSDFCEIKCKNDNIVKIKNSKRLIVSISKCKCSKCHNKRPITKYNIDICRKMGLEKEGVCLSEKYVINQKLKWRCKFSHVFYSKIGSVKNGHWCPECASGLFERVTRICFNNIFNNNFVKAQPSWLINSNGNQMELDGYCSQIGVAFEFNGEQHYKNISKFKSNNLERRMKLDQEKRDLCINNNVKLYEIRGKNINEILFDINNKLNVNCFAMDLSTAYQSNAANIQYYKLEKFCIKNNFSIIDGTYVDNQSIFTLKCECGYNIKRKFVSILAYDKIYCKKCKNNKYPVRKALAK